MSKKVLVSIVDGFHYRYLISSGVIDRFIVESGFNVDFVVSSPAIKDLIEKKYSNSRIYTFKTKDLSLFNRLYLYYIFHSNKEISETINIKNERKKRRYFEKIVSIFSVFLLSFFSFRLVFVKNYNYLILSTPAQKTPDIYISFMAKLFSKKIISPVYSWDNLTAKGPFAFKPDRLLVWNNIMIDEAVRYQHMEKSKVFSTGVPIYDEYKEVLKNKSDKESFLRKLGFSDCTKDLVTITTIPRIYYGDGHLSIVESILNSTLSKDINILIRPHPMDETDYSFLQEMNCNVVVDNYGTLPDSSLKYWKPKSDNVFHLGQTMMFSSVVINVASTITIDASWFNTPVINLAINYDPNLGDSSRFYSYTHYKHVMETNSSYLVHTESELIEKLSSLLQGFDVLSSNRKYLINKMCLGHDYDSISDTVKGLIM